MVLDSYFRPDMSGADAPKIGGGKPPVPRYGALTRLFTAGLVALMAASYGCNNGSTLDVFDSDDKVIRTTDKPFGCQLCDKYSTDKYRFACKDAKDDDECMDKLGDMLKAEVENHGKTQGDLASARAELDSRTLTDFGDITNPADCIEACLDIDPDDCDEAWSMLTAAKKAASKAWKFLYSLACVYKGPKSCPDCPPVEEKSCGEAPYVNIEREPTGGDMVPLDP